MTELTHFNDQGEAHMVDVGAKASTQRIAIAAGEIHMLPDTLKAILEGDHNKGDVLAVARLAGIMAAKKTADLIPLCHQLMLSKVELEFAADVEQQLIACTAEVHCSGQTGVEMEALTAVQIALLTIYDMCKAVDRGMSMQNIRLQEKSGGKSGHFVND